MEIPSIDCRTAGGHPIWAVVQVEAYPLGLPLWALHIAKVGNFSLLSSLNVERLTLGPLPFFFIKNRPYSFF